MKSGNLSTLPVGVLAVHIKRATKISIDNDKNELGDWSSLMLRIIVNDVSKESKISPIESNLECKFDDLRHFFVRINPIKENIKNEIKLELYAFGYTEIDPHHSYLCKLANRFINIIDLVRLMNVSEEFEMTDNKRLVALLDLELCFSYGNFGYGYSNQIDNTFEFYKINKLITLQDKLSFSTFLRFKPPNYRKIKETDVMETVTVSQPKIFNISENASEKSRNLPFIYEINSFEFPLFKNYMNERKCLNNVKNELNTFKSRYERLEYLNSLLNNRESYLNIDEYN
jgi:hypothetical protein